jgi:hypothetical protein
MTVGFVAIECLAVAFGVILWLLGKRLKAEGLEP